MEKGAKTDDYSDDETDKGSVAKSVIAEVPVSTETPHTSQVITNKRLSMNELDDIEPRAKKTVKLMLPIVEQGATSEDETI